MEVTDVTSFSGPLQGTHLLTKFNFDHSMDK